METMCATASDNTGIYTPDIACSTTDTNLAGWCAIDVNGDGTKGIYTVLSLSPMADCAGNEMACTTWVAGGVYIPDGACSASAGDEEGGEEEDAIIVDALAAIMANPIMGSCTYTYTISNGTSCFEFRGEEWTIEDMMNRCALSGGMDVSESDDSDATTTTTTTTNTTGGGVLSTTAGVGCTISKEDDALMVVAGYCDETIDVGRHEVTLMIITDGADCTANELVCTAYKGGVFGSDSACGGGGGGANTTSPSTTTDDVVNEALSSESINEDDEVASSLSQLDIPGANDDAVGSSNEESVGSSEVPTYAAPISNNGDEVTVVAVDDDDDEMITTMGGPDYPINGVDVTYVDVEGTLLLGYLSLPSPAAKSSTVNNAATTSTANDGKLPAVIVIHGQDGISMYEKQRASILSSSEGYVGFAADIYGIDAILPPSDADFMSKGVFTSTYTGNVTLFTQRIQAAIDYVSSLDEVDENRVAIIGYCFGGIGVVHYLNTRGSNSSSSGADTTTNPAVLLAGAIAYHPTLLQPLPGPIGQIDIPSLFLTGGADFLNGPETMTKLELDMVDAPSLATWETVRYGNIGHAWTNWFNADMYNQRADFRSWDSGMTFLKIVFDIDDDDDDGFNDMPPSSSEVVNSVYYAYDLDSVSMDDGENNTTLLGYVSVPDWIYGPLLPVVIILHFNTSYAQLIATQIANTLGYVAFVADLISEDVCRANTTKYLSLITAAINHVKDMGNVDSTRLAIMGFDYGGNGALYYAMLENTKFDPSVLAIASFHGELDLVAVETATLTTDLASSSTGGGGGNESGEFDWSSMGGGVGTSGEEFDWTTMTDGDGSSGSDYFGSNNSTGGGGNETSEFDWSSGKAAGELSGEEFDWTTMTTGGGDDGSGTNNNNNSTRNRKVISLDIDEALIAAEKGYTTTITSNSKPQILIFSGVEGDDMTNVLAVEQTLIGMNANYEILRFAHTSGSFTTWGSTSYNHHSSLRSMVQWESILSEIFPPLVVISSTPPSPSVVTSEEPSIDDVSSKSTLLTCGTSILVGSVIFPLWTVITALM
jgi:dienelactone hydrolase